MAGLMHLFLSLLGLIIRHDPMPSTNILATGGASTCSLYVEGNGSVNCTGDFQRNVCDVECDGEHRGTFECTTENGWSSELPYCAREVTRDKKTSTYMGGCEDSRCVAFCRESHKRGSCKEAYPGGELLCLCDD